MTQALLFSQLYHNIDLTLLSFTYPLVFLVLYWIGKLIAGYLLRCSVDIVQYSIE